MMFTDIKEQFRQLYLKDAGPRLGGFSCGNINSYFDDLHDATGRFAFVQTVDSMSLS